MTRTALAAKAALLAAPLLALASAALSPTVADGDVTAMETSRRAMLIGHAISTLSIMLLTAGTIWLALSLARSAPRLALGGGILGVAGSLIVLFEDGITAGEPAVVSASSHAQALGLVNHIEASAFRGLEPLALLGDLGLALLALAAVRAGAPRWSAIATAAGAFAEGAGFATGTRVVVIAGFAVLLAGLVGLTSSRTDVAASTAETLRGPSLSETA